MSLPSDISGKPVSSESVICLPERTEKYEEQTATSFIGFTFVSTSEAARTVGVVTTAMSAEPSLKASIACGVEWLLILMWIPGYSNRYFFNTGSSKQRKATSLAAIYTVPF